MEKEIPMRNGSWTVFGAFLALSLAAGFAGESKPAPGPGQASAGAAAAGKTAAPSGAVEENAIQADADGHCAKAKADCPKGSAADCEKMHGKAAGTHAGQASKGAAGAKEDAADCPKDSDCRKHGHCLKHKTGKAEAAPATGEGAGGTPGAKPAEAAKSGSQQG